MEDDHVKVLGTLLFSWVHSLTCKRFARAQMLQQVFLQLKKTIEMMLIFCGTSISDGTAAAAVTVTAAAALLSV